jgi:hypothetical protein
MNDPTEELDKSQVEKALKFWKMWWMISFVSTLIDIVLVVGVSRSYLWLVGLGVVNLFLCNMWIKHIEQVLAKLNGQQETDEQND